MTATGLSQQWNRTFDHGSKSAVVYTTTHSTYSLYGKTHLVESVGGILDKLFSFIYDISVDGSPTGITVSYKSTGLMVNGLALLLLVPTPINILFLRVTVPPNIAFRVPLPSWLLPQNNWTEVPTPTGWKFSGSLHVPFIGRIMNYIGDFNIVNNAVVNNKPSNVATADASSYPRERSVAIVAGGTGLLGSAVCEELLLRGWDVIVLTRNAAIQTNGKSKGSKRQENFRLSLQ